MKKVCIVIALVLFTTACQSDRDEQLNNDVKVDSEVKSLGSSKTLTLPPLQDLDEYEQLTSVINIQDFIPTMEMDDEQQRIILFKNNLGEQQYKSVYVKSENRLEIVDYTRDGHVFNDVIK